jgi:hypothetical protein
MAMNELAGLVRRAVDEIWNRGRIDLADRLFAPNYVNHGGLIPDLVRGPEAIKLSVTLYRLAFPDLQIAIEDLVADRETVALRWLARGTPVASGDTGVVAEGRGALAGVTFSRFAGRQIAESWTYWEVESEPYGFGLFPPRSRRRAERDEDGAVGFVA